MNNVGRAACTDAMSALLSSIDHGRGLDGGLATRRDTLGPPPPDGLLLLAQSGSEHLSFPRLGWAACGIPSLSLSGLSAVRSSRGARKERGHEGHRAIPLRSSR